MEITPSYWRDNFGCIPSAKDLSDKLGGDRSIWGRILTGKSKPSDEYYAKLKSVTVVGLESVRFYWQVAEMRDEYRTINRKGNIVPHFRNIYFALERFCAERIVQEKMDKMQFKNSTEEFWFYSDQIEIYTSGQKNPMDFLDDQTVYRDFIESLS